MFFLVVVSINKLEKNQLIMCKIPLVKMLD